MTIRERLIRELSRSSGVSTESSTYYVTPETPLPQIAGEIVLFKIAGPIWPRKPPENRRERIASRILARLQKKRDRIRAARMERERAIWHEDHLEEEKRIRYRMSAHDIRYPHEECSYMVSGWDIGDMEGAPDNIPCACFSVAEISHLQQLGRVAARASRVLAQDPRAGHFLQVIPMNAEFREKTWSPGPTRPVSEFNFDHLDGMARLINVYRHPFSDRVEQEYDTKKATFPDSRVFESSTGLRLPDRTGVSLRFDVLLY